MATIEREPESEGSKKELLEYWQRRMELAEKKLKKRGGDIKQGKWKGLVEFYEGNQWGDTKSRSYHRITANQCKSNIDSIRPQLYFQNPKVRIRLKNPVIADQPVFETQQQFNPASGQFAQVPLAGPDGQPIIRVAPGRPTAVVNGIQVDAQEQIELIEAIDNYYFEETGAKTKIRRCVNDSLILPYGCAKWEWVVEVEEQEEAYEDENGETKIRTIEVEGRKYARLSRIKPWLFLWDCDLQEFDLDQAAWVAEIKYLSKEDIENDENLDVDMDKIAESATYLDDDYSEAARSDASGEEDYKRYKLYEIHDLRRKEFLVWIEGSDRINRHDVPNPYADVEGSIYTLLGYHETPIDSMPLPITEQIKSKAEAYNFMVSYQVNHAGRFNRKYKLLKNTMDREEKEKLTKGADGEIVEYEGGQGPEPIQDASISPDVYNVAKILKAEITEDIGVTAYDRGTRETGVDTAYEASIIQGGADIKIQEKRDIVREFVRKLVKKLNQILKVYATSKQAIEIVGPKGSKWVQWSKEDISGEFVEDVDIYNSLPYSRETEKRQIMELVGIANGNPYVNQERLWQRCFRAFDMGDELLNTPAERQAAMAAQQQQEQIEESKRQSSKGGRPGGGEKAQTPADMQGGLLGGELRAGPSRRAQ